jgi:sulfur relay (sulfurtransferase) DsrF/TusC family protein
LGNGRDEFVAPLITRGEDARYFYVFDQAKRKLVGYSLSDSGAQLVTEKLIQEDSRNPFQELFFISDSVFLFLSVNNEVISYNINKDMMIDTLAFNSDIKDKVYGDEEYNKSLDSFHFSNIGDKIVTGHHYINKITTNTCNADGLFENKNISLSAYTRDYIDSNLGNNMYYYLFVEATPNFIFAEYYGYPSLQLQPFPVNMGRRHLDFILEVYDWNLDKKAILEFDSEILRCTIDEKRKKIYTWNYLKDFDYLLCYDIRELYQE